MPGMGGDHVVARLRDNRAARNIRVCLLWARPCWLSR